MDDEIITASIGFFFLFHQDMPKTYRFLKCQPPSKGVKSKLVPKKVPNPPLQVRGMAKIVEMGGPEQK